METAVKNFIVEPCLRSEIESFIEINHYSHNLNGVKTQYCFKLMDKDKLIGAMVLAKLGMAGVWKKYAEDESLVIELRRLVCIDDTPKNTESFFIGKVLRWLIKNTKILTVVSYADKTYGHSGVIYKASNFTFTGETAPGRMIRLGERLYHDKTIRTYYKGELKPYAKKIQEALITGEAFYVKTLSKNIYVMNLKRKNH